MQRAKATAPLWCADAAAVFEEVPLSVVVVVEPSCAT
jgi:hypothetical protein